MKIFTLPNRELRLLSGQLQNFKVGYTVEQIRLLDRVIKTINSSIKPFEDALTAKVSELEKEKDEEAKNKTLENFLDTEGVKEIVITFEDVDFDFIKLIWSNMANMSGGADARSAIIKIDDAIKNASDPTFESKSKLN